LRFGDTGRHTDIDGAEPNLETMLNASSVYIISNFSGNWNSIMIFITATTVPGYPTVLI
jgi:hypothetical protein